jgi:hypothetical protein
MTWTNGVGSLALLAALGGCGGVPPAPAPEPLVPEVVTKTRIVDTGCQWVKPIYPAPADIIADSTAAQINGHNAAGVSHCGWVAPKK